MSYISGEGKDLDGQAETSAVCPFGVSVRETPSCRRLAVSISSLVPKWLSPKDRPTGDLFSCFRTAGAVL